MLSTLSRSSFAALGLLATLLVADATQVMHRPSGYKETPNSFKTAEVYNTTTVSRREATTSAPAKRAGGKTSFAYFTNWGIYGANFQPQDIVDTDLTHILYSFADVSADSGALKLTDSFADEEKHYDGDSWSEAGNNIYGCLKQLYLLKLSKRSLKVLLSVGGWTYSQAGHFGFVTNAGSRATFVSNAVQLIEDYGFDGIDLDFEYPSNSAQGQGFADLLSELRTAFDNLASSKGDSTTYEITAAVSAGPDNYANLVVPQMDAALSYWNLMAYDYAGSWLTITDHQANVYGGERTGVSTDAAVKYFTGAGATASKINMGIPLYGRAFEETDGIGSSFNGIGPGTTEAGIYSYETLPLAGAQVFEDTSLVASYSYDSAKRELVSYDTPNIVKIKSQYINDKGLAGSMFWELSTDRVGSESLVSVAAGVLGGLDSTENHINYPSSKWDNIKSNMGGSTGGGGDTTPPPTGGSCGSVAAYDNAAVYTGGMQASSNGHLWTAAWWTQGEAPPGTSGVWSDAGAC